MVSSGVEMREIRTFLVLAEELHFGRAAERLGLTTSRVSQTIRTLEGRAGGQLFDRTSRRVALTPLGQQLREQAGPAYAQLERVLSSVREAATGVTGVLRLGMYAPVNGGPHLLQIIRKFQDRYPGCKVRVTDTGFERDQLDWLRSNDLDLLAMRLPVNDPGITIGPILSREPRILAVATSHPLAARSSVCLEDLADYPVADISTLPRELISAFLPGTTPSGRSVQRILVRTIGESLTRVALGETVHPTVQSFLEHARHPDITAVPISDLPPSETALIWLTDHTSSKINAFVQTTASILKTLR
jgi:DNA-binding transcriptional LysR family regulator